MKRPIQLKNDQIILDVEHIIGVFARDNFVAGDLKWKYVIELLLFYGEKAFSQIITYLDENLRQHDLKRLALAILDKD